MLHFHADGILWKLYRENVAFIITNNVCNRNLNKRVSPKKVGDSLKIGFIGAGKVGFSLGKYFAEHDLHVSGYYSRNLNSAKEAAIFTRSYYYETLEDIIKESDTLFLTVSDTEIAKIYSDILKYNLRGKIVAHCSGAMTSEIFSGISQKGALGCSVHPICAVSNKQTGYQELSKAFFTIEGEDNNKIFTILQSCGNTVERLSSQNKIKYHAAAVFVSNLVVSLYEYGSSLLKECELSEDFANKALIPLFLQNCKNIVEKGTIQALTGPLERGDEETIRKHLSVLPTKEKDLYCLLSEGLLSVARQKNQERDYEKIKKLLEDRTIR